MDLLPPSFLTDLAQAMQTTGAPQPTSDEDAATALDTLVKTGTVKGPANEDLGSTVLRGFLNSSETPLKPPPTYQDFVTQYRQSISPAREMLADFLGGVASSMTGQKFVAARDRAYATWKEDVDNEMQTQQQERMRQQALMTQAGELVRQRQQQQFATDMENAKTRRGALEFVMKYGQTAQQIQQRQQTNNIRLMELAQQVKQANEGGMKVADANYEQALRETNDLYKLNNANLQDPATKVKFNLDVAKRKADIDEAEAKLKQKYATNNNINVDLGASDSAPDPNSQSILAQTGLSYPAFLALTGQVTKLPRDRATRTAALREAASFANKQGVDVSTLASQYQSYNTVLASNIDRMNRTKIMESELQGTIENLQGVVNDTALSKLNYANVVKIWAGQNVNDSLAQQYAMHLYQLRNELAAYGAATQGRSGNQITIEDMREAERAIRSGIATGSLKGLETAVHNSTDKMSNVMQRSVDVARKSVWNLFGVGQNYKDTAPSNAPKATHRYNPATGKIEEIK